MSVDRTWRSKALASLVAPLVLAGVVLALGCSHKQSVPAEYQQQARFEVLGMDCPSCEAQVTKALADIEGVLEVQTSVDQRRVDVTFDSREIWSKSIEGEIARLGYQIASLDLPVAARPGASQLVSSP